MTFYAFVSSRSTYFQLCTTFGAQLMSAKMFCDANIWILDPVSRILDPGSRIRIQQLNCIYANKLRLGDHCHSPPPQGGGASGDIQGQYHMSDLTSDVLIILKHFLCF